MSINLTQGRSISLDSIMNKTLDNCNECNNNKRKIDCDKCGNALCKSLKCSWIFQHKYNTNYVICDTCYKSIDNKLINYDHLLIYNFLKKNTNKRRLSC